MMLVTHPLGNACVRAVLVGLETRALLACYLTTLGFHRGDCWIGWLPVQTRRQLVRRFYDLPRERVQRWPMRETARLLGQGLGFSSWIAHERGWASVDAVFRDLDRRAAAALDRFGGLRGVYAYEDGALELFRVAERRGLARCYELPMGYWREAQRIFQEEAELQPEWAETLDGLKDSTEKLVRKDEELARASHVVVASGFSRRCVATFPRPLAAPVSVVPHGAPPPVSEAALKQRLRERRAGPLRVLFVGGLSQRKGLSYLFAAMQLVGPRATLTLVGRAPADVRCPALTAALRAHRHIPSLAPESLFELMCQHDVLVLPSLFEGFGLVLSEAMAQGLPVIATPHTAAPDLFSGEDAGAIVPIRSAEAIAEAMLGLAADAGCREAMALAARRIAERADWAACSARLTEICLDAMQAASSVTR